ncbi:MAG: hypothetical protein PF447_10135 [Spirochaetaceae bacterium]|jgi:hypothetical protein|nr:hypothetical protein [Spirochaetaceae bacterium]
MKGRIERIKDLILQGLEKLDNIKSVQLVSHDKEDIYDPYFILSFDLYYNGNLQEDRREIYPHVELFESSPSGSKDRLLIDNLPIRLEYRGISRIEALFAALEGNMAYPSRELSFLVNRINNGKILMDNQDWLKGYSEKAKNLPEFFWKKLLGYYISKTENYLNDLRAASLRNDSFFFQLSLGNFLRNSGGLLMALNYKTEPSPRYFNEALNKLNLLPDGFKANYGSLLRSHNELTMERKSEVATLYTRSILGLLPAY